MKWAQLAVQRSLPQGDPEVYCAYVLNSLSLVKQKAGNIPEAMPVQLIRVWSY
jgi:hypothetical protein